MGTFSERVRLTKNAVDKAQPAVIEGKARTRLYWDTSLRGFGLAVGSTTKTFVVQRDVHGKSVRAVVGRYNPLTVDEARKKARKMLVKMGDGVDLNKEKRAAAARGVTLAEAVDLMTESAISKKRSSRTIADYRRLTEKYLSDWLNKPLAEITRADVYARHKKITKEVASGKYGTYKKGDAILKYKRNPEYWNGRNTANRVLKMFGAVWRRAARQHESLPTCPTIAIDWHPEHRRAAALGVASLPAWYSEVMALQNPIRRDLLIFLLLTGLRRTNGVEVRWEHVNLEHKTLHVPKPKSGRPFDMPLSNQLVELLQRRKKENADFFPRSQWVFPAASSKSGHISEVKVELSMKWMPHDLRRLFISVAESLNISPYAIKLLVNHSVPRDDVTAGYLQVDAERLRDPMQQISNKLLGLCQPSGGGDNSTAETAITNVLQFPGKTAVTS